MTDWEFIRVPKQIHLRLCRIRELEKHPNIHSVIKNALDVYEDSPKLTLLWGTEEVWSRSV